MIRDSVSCVLCFDFHAFLCPFSVSCVLPSVFPFPLVACLSPPVCRRYFSSVLSPSFPHLPSSLLSLLTCSSSPRQCVCVVKPLSPPFTPCQCIWLHLNSNLSLTHSALYTIFQLSSCSWYCSTITPAKIQICLKSFMSGVVCPWLLSPARALTVGKWMRCLPA